LEGFVNLKELNCGGNKITRLEIVSCPKLEEIDCSVNELTGLNIRGCSQLKRLCAYSNLLTNLDLSQNKELEELNIDNNNFSQQNLSFLKGLNNLKKVYLGNNIEWKINQGIYNRFTGSLKFLKRMSKLEWCDISNTDIDGGLEYLPKSVENFRCLASCRPDAKVKVFAELESKKRTFFQKFQTYKQKFRAEIQVQSRRFSF
jgi:Leucine-rich repeat (LRR) protein